MLIPAIVLIVLATALVILDLRGLVKPAVQRFARTGFARGFAEAPIFNTILLLANLAAAVFIAYQQGAYPQPGGNATTIIQSGAVSPTTSYSASPNCPIAGTTNCTFVFDDGLVVASDVTTTLAGVITCPNNDCNFTTITQPQYGSTIVGMQAWVYPTTAGAPQIGVAPSCALSTVATVNGAQSITLTSGNCASALTATGILIIGHKDGANLATAITAANCGKLQLPSFSANPIAPVGTPAWLLMERGQYNANFNACKNYSGIDNPVQPSLEGGIFSTGFILTPDFPFTIGNCAGAISGYAKNVCFGPAAVIFRGLLISGYGFASCGTASLAMIAAPAGVISTVQVSNICPSNTNLTGAALSPFTRFEQGGVLNVGTIAGQVYNPGSIQSPSYTYDSLFNNGGNPTGQAIGMQVDSGATLVDTSSGFVNNLVNGTEIANGTKHDSYLGSGGLNASVALENATARYNCVGCSLNASVIGAGSAALYVPTSGASAQIQGTPIWNGAPSAGAPMHIGAGAILDDMGGNICPNLNGGSQSIFDAGAIVAENRSVAKTFPVASSNASLGSTSVISGANCVFGAPLSITVNAWDSAAGTSCTGNTTIAWTLSYTDATGTAQTQTGTETITTNGGATGGDPFRITWTITPQVGSAVNISNTYTIGSACSPGPKYAAQIATRG